MRVAELITHLQQMPPDARVYVDDQQDFPEVVIVIADRRLPRSMDWEREHGPAVLLGVCQPSFKFDQ